MVPGTPYDNTRVDSLLLERGVTATPSGQRVWRLKGGDVEVGELRENGLVVATELRVPLAESADLVREVVEEGATLAAAAEVRLVDPQLGRPLSANDSGSVADQFMRTARYAGEMMGLPEAVAASYAPQPEGLPMGFKLLLAIGGGFLLLYFIVSSMLEKLGG